MKVQFTKFNGQWVEGTVEEYIFQAKFYDEPSIYGINSGRVSKLTIWPKETNWTTNILNYDRGWDHEPETVHDKEIFKKVLGFLENSPKRFS